MAGPWFPGGEGAFVLYPSALSSPGGWQCPSSPVVQTGYPGALLKLQGQGHEGSVFFFFFLAAVNTIPLQ